MRWLGYSSPIWPRFPARSCLSSVGLKEILVGWLGWHINYSCYIQMPGTRFEFWIEWQLWLNFFHQLTWIEGVCWDPLPPSPWGQPGWGGGSVRGGLQGVAAGNPECSALCSELTLPLAGVGLETSHGHFQDELSCGPGSGPGYAEHYAEGC